MKIPKLFYIPLISLTWFHVSLHSSSLLTLSISLFLSGFFGRTHNGSMFCSSIIKTSDHIWLDPSWPQNLTVSFPPLHYKSLFILVHHNSDFCHHHRSSDATSTWHISGFKPIIKYGFCHFDDSCFLLTNDIEVLTPNLIWVSVRQSDEASIVLKLVKERSLCH